jgi:hypothetical protein
MMELLNVDWETEFSTCSNDVNNGNFLVANLTMLLKNVYQ